MTFPRLFPSWCPPQNVVLFAGSAKDRDLIEEYEFYRSGGGSTGSGSGSRCRDGREVKFHVLLASYETMQQV